jgi:hypothetical protein
LFLNTEKKDRRPLRLGRSVSLRRCTSESCSHSAVRRCTYVSSSLPIPPFGRQSACRWASLGLGPAQSPLHYQNNGGRTHDRHVGVSAVSSRLVSSVDDVVVSFRCPAGRPCFSAALLPEPCRSIRRRRRRTVEEVSNEARKGEGGSCVRVAGELGGLTKVAAGGGRLAGCLARSTSKQRSTRFVGRTNKTNRVTTRRQGRVWGGCDWLTG